MEQWGAILAPQALFRTFEGRFAPKEDLSLFHCFIV
jgi:hypothetical protein